MSFGNNSSGLHQYAQPLQLNELGTTVVLAPHQDDEALGCGGTIALLRKAKKHVHVIFVSNGSMSHPNSKAYPKEERIALREKEAIDSLEVLGVSPSDITFLRLQDGDVPTPKMPGFNEAVLLLLQQLQSLKPLTLLVPWKRDPHKDHRATWDILQGALQQYRSTVRVLQYFIWLWERSQPEDLPTTNQQILWKVDIETVTVLKEKAIMKHVSQVTRLIDDDPQGFMLSPEVLAHFSGNEELFAEDTEAQKAK